MSLCFRLEMINTEQHEVIGWRDPSEMVEDTPKRNPKPKNVPCFSISCNTDEMKNRLIAQIMQLNGKVCENLLKYDSSCTHFVCEKPSRSEKMLSCVAAGKWVLSLSYIQKSFEAKRFVNVIAILHIFRMLFISIDGKLMALMCISIVGRGIRMGKSKSNINPPRRWK